MASCSESHKQLKLPENRGGHQVSTNTGPWSMQQVRCSSIPVHIQQGFKVHVTDGKGLDIRLLSTQVQSTCSRWKEAGYQVTFNTGPKFTQEIGLDTALYPHYTQCSQGGESRSPLELSWSCWAMRGLAQMKLFWAMRSWCSEGSAKPQQCFRRHL